MGDSFRAINIWLIHDSRGEEFVNISRDYSIRQNTMGDFQITWAPFERNFFSGRILEATKAKNKLQGAPPYDRYKWTYTPYK